MRALAFESFRFVSHASNAVERRISYTESPYPIGDAMSTMVYVPKPDGYRGGYAHGERGGKIFLKQPLKRIFNSGRGRQTLIVYSDEIGDGLYRRHG
jgi:hypothetical protein